MKLLNVAIGSTLFFSLALTSCSKILSQRTDEQAWMEFDKELRSSRMPASAMVEHKTQGFLALHETLAAVPVRLILLKCGNEANPNVCFHSALVLKFDEAFRTTQKQFSDVKPTDYKSEQEAFLSFRSFENVVDEVSRFHQSILSGLDWRARAHAQDLFKICEDENQKDSIIQNFGVLTNLIYDVPKGTYACLNDHWHGDQKQLLEETTDRLGLLIVTEDAKRWIQAHQISPLYEDEVNVAVGKKAHEESERFKLEKGKVLAEFDFKAPKDKLLKEWSPKLREKYPHSPVEQWILAYAKERQ